MKSPKLLFVASRFPHPSRQGDAIRAYWFLHRISQSHQVTLVAPVAPDEVSVSIEAMQGVCDRFVPIPTRKSLASLNVVRPSALTMPLQVLYFCPRQLTGVVNEMVTSEKFDLAHVQLARMGPVIDVLGNTPCVIDFVDALSLNMIRRAEQETCPKKLLFQMEGKRMLRYEQELIDKTCFQVVNSPVDKKALGNKTTTHVVPNGVAIENYSYKEKSSVNQDIILSGNMFYFPNVDAAIFFAKEVFPLVREQLPNARFLIVGANPLKQVLELGENRGVVVTGSVPDLKSYIQGASVSVAPTRAGSGMQLKILEAMALGTPVVATSRAVGGAQVEHEKHLMIADTPEDFAQQVVRLLSDTALALDIRRRGRTLVEKSFNWQCSADIISTLYQSVLQR
jgi:polysaccharide biosynthesis protein PslH